MTEDLKAAIENVMDIAKRDRHSVAIFTLDESCEQASRSIVGSRAVISAVIEAIWGEEDLRPYAELCLEIMREDLSDGEMLQ